MAQKTRREFLVHTGCGALSSAALLSGLGRFALIDALAQGSDPDYRALVCVFLFGGNDANNVVIPYTDYQSYYNWRPFDNNNPNIARVPFAIPQDQLLQITPPSAQGAMFGLNPKLGEATAPAGEAPAGTIFTTLFDIWNQSNAAIVCNTGPLIRPLTRTDYLSNIARPYQLFSHSDQQNLWQTSNASGPNSTGWGGLTAEKTPGSGSDQFPAISSISGVTVFSTGQNTRPLVLSPAPTLLRDTLHLLRTTDQQAIMDALTAAEQDPMSALIQGAAQITDKALGVSSALAGQDPPVNTVFPNTSLGNQLKQVAKVIRFVKDNPSLGVKKQIFFASIGGFDTHTGQGDIGTDTGQLKLLRQLSQAIGALYQATGPDDLDLRNKVTIFTSSDFSRTFVPGGDRTGTDHAWGSHQFVVGGAVQGGDFYGQYPSLTLGTGDPPDSLDTDRGGGARGRWIPTTSVDQYAATLAAWYGLDLGQFSQTVFPNLVNFSQQTLGFLPAAGAGPALARPGFRPRTTGLRPRTRG
jgi:uncharacterized protein (DUF1501 family)